MLRVYILITYFLPRCIILHFAYLWSHSYDGRHIVTRSDKQWEVFFEMQIQQPTVQYILVLSEREDKSFQLLKSVTNT